MITLLHIYLLKKLQLLRTLQQLDKQQIKKVIFKNCAPFSSCIRRINNTQIDHAQYIDAVMPIHNLIEYSVDYSNLKDKVTGQTIANGTKNVEIMVPLKYLSNFWRTLEMPLINC